MAINRTTNLPEAFSARAAQLEGTTMAFAQAEYRAGSVNMPSIDNARQAQGPTAEVSGQSFDFTS